MLTTNLPNHRIVHSIMKADSALLVIMSNAVLFDITLQASDFSNTLLGAQLMEWLDKLAPTHGATCSEEDFDDTEVFEDFCDWLIQPCAEYIQRNAPNIEQPIDLQRFSFGPHHSLRLLPMAGIIRPVRTDELHPTSAIPMVNTSISNLPPGIQRVSAADVFILQDPNSQFDPACDSPRHVRVAGNEFFFKPITTSAEFEREVSILHRISKLGLSINVSKLYAVVLSKDEKFILGALLDWFPFGSRTLWNDEFIKMKEHHALWETQVLKVMDTLHVNNIVWGDVNPGNIVIDYELNTWVIDFAGGFLEEFVDKESAGTKQGDRNGIHNVFHNWLLG